MEDYTFKVSTPCVTDKVLHSFGCLLGEEPKVHISDGGVDSCSIGNW